MARTWAICSLRTPSLAAETPFREPIPENLYWVDALGNLSTCPLPTCASPRVLVAGTVSATRLWVDATGIYWVGGRGGSIDKVGLDGGAPTVLASNAEQADRLAVGPTCVFWANFDPQAVRSSLNAIAK